MVPRITPRSPRHATLLAALVAALLGAFGGASPASADVVRSGSATGPGGLFDGAHHPGACWRPFSAASPFNQRLPTNDSRTEPNSSAIVDRLNAFGAPNPLEFGPGEDGQGRGAKAVYFSKPTDPLYEVQLLNATGRGGPWGANPLDGAQIRIPDGARPGKYSDRHMVVVDQQQNVSYDLWQVNQDVLSGGGTITASWGGKISLAGDGRTQAGDGSSNAAGLGLLGGILRPEELAQGDIPHALYMSVQCTNGTSVFPSTRPADDGEKDCASSGGGDDADAPALGQRFQLGYSDQQIAAMNVPPHEKVLLRAMAHYGLFVIDTTPEAWHIDQESSIDRPALGLPDPGVTFAQKAGLDFYADRNRYVLSLASIPGRDGRAGSWTRDLRALQPCVTSGDCAAQKVAKTPAKLWPVGRAVKSRTTVTATVSVRTSATVSSPAAASASATATATATAHIRRPSWLKRARGARKVRGEKVAVDRAAGRAHAQARSDARKLAAARAQGIAYERAAQGGASGG